jgi:membrane fusion protein (multidrug efflux system)
VAHDDFDDKTRPGSFFDRGPTDATAMEPAYEPQNAPPPARRAPMVGSSAAQAPTMMAAPVVVPAAAPPPPPVDDDRSSIFRREAIEAHARPKSEGELLRLSPSWTSWTFYLLIALFLVGAVYSVAGTLNEWAAGPGLVVIDGRVPVVARSSGIVLSVEVQPGQRVSRGQLLARFNSQAEQTQFEEAKTQYEALVRRVLRDPGDQAARAQVGDRESAMQLARQRFENSAYRAEEAGIISDIRIVVGQSINGGDEIFSIVKDGAKYRFRAYIPGHNRPLLRKGQKMRIEMAGYRYAFREVTIDSVNDEVIGLAQVQQSLRMNPAELGISRDVVMVEASLPTTDFQADGKTLSYHDGMRGTAEVQVKSQMVLLSFIPGLKAVFGGN